MRLQNENFVIKKVIKNGSKNDNTLVPGPSFGGTVWQ